MACRVLFDKDAVITCPFGPRVHPVTGARSSHNGVDVVGAGHTLASITAHTAGTVEYAGYNAILGYHINIRLANGDMMQYCHMTKSLQAAVGDAVEEGQIIGTMGSTGSSTGAHLHFGIQKDGQWIDPEPYLYSDYLEDTMTYEDFKAFMDRYEVEQAAKPVSDWAAKNWNALQAEGIFDGTKPQAPLTRQEAAAVICRLRKEK